MKNELLRAIPAVDEFASALKKKMAHTPWPLLVRIARETIHHARERILEGDISWSPETIIGILKQKADSRLQQLKLPIPAINATGVVLHTGLGRAPLSASAIDAVCETASRYCTLEIDRESGNRHSRLSYVDELVKTWSGAQASMVVNNNAAAMYLCLHEFARGKKVIIPRAQMVEIGGSFRLPEILAASGAKVVEIGATNKVRLSDYEQVLDSETALILNVHTSNYRVVGFTEFISLSELSSLGKKHHIPVLFDEGSGAGVEWEGHIASDEPLIQKVVKEGVDLVTFSGDKLLGGPQSGMIVGHSDLVSRLKKSPLARAFRVDKMTLAALAATLELYLKGEESLQELPIYPLISAPAEIVKAKGARLLELLKESGVTAADFDLVECIATIGGGSVPGEEIPSWAVTVSTKEHSIDTFAKRLRRNTPPVFGYIESGLLRLDLRTVWEDQIIWVAKAVVRSLKEGD